MSESPRSVVVAHNYYQQAGGEDQVFGAETALLEAKGHCVVRYEEHNSGITNPAAAAAGAVWSRAAHRGIGEAVRKARAEVVHFHNTFPLISPAAYYAARGEGAAVVQTLHNYRLVCPAATLFRDGMVCELCLDQGSFRPAMLHKCYRGSRPATATVAGMLTLHGAARTWRRKVDLYIALSQFARRKFIGGGLPERKIFVKPNFVSPDPGVGSGEGGYALFVGRLSAEKGIATLVEAWKELEGFPLVVVGDGPLGVSGQKMGTDGSVHPAPGSESDCADFDSRLGTESSVPIFLGGSLHAAPESDGDCTAPIFPAGVNWVGRQPREKVFELMREARVLIVPSVWYEGCPMAILEAFACGLPVIASDLGSMAEAVDHERTGYLFEAGDAADLARKVRLAFAGGADGMRAEARKEFEEKYTAERNYELLMAAYETAVSNFKH